jgi:membrane-bound lytic murein transglycosylase B
VSPVRWLRAVAVVGATALLMASSCSWQLGTPIPDGVPPSPGDPVPKIDTHARGRPADQLHEWAAQRAPALGMPVGALEAYAYAARVAEVENPDCHLAWTTLAGIGQVESHHGTYRGANNDGIISPDNFDDAALSAAGYLCWRGKDLAKPRGWMDALHAYNHSDQYARTVRDWATAYANGHPL